MQTSILRAVQDVKFFNLFIETVNFPINYAVLINISALLFLTESTPDIRHFKY